MSIPNWLGTPQLTAVNNQLTTTTTISSITYYNTPVNVVPQVILTNISTAQLNTNNPSEIISYTIPQNGWYKTDYTGFAFHVSAGDWSNLSQLDWYAKKNNSIQSNTTFICKPEFICGDSVSEFISIYGGGLFPASNGDLIEWTTDGNTGGGPAITSNYFSGFSQITIQKIG
jgi:hypothetical protein